MWEPRVQDPLPLDDRHRRQPERVFRGFQEPLGVPHAASSGLQVGSVFLFLSYSLGFVCVTFTPCYVYHFQKSKSTDLHSAGSVQTVMGAWLCVREVQTQLGSFKMCTCTFLYSYKLADLCISALSRSVQGGSEAEHTYA